MGDSPVSKPKADEAKQKKNVMFLYPRNPNKIVAILFKVSNYWSIPQYGCPYFLSQIPIKNEKFDT